MSEVLRRGTPFAAMCRKTCALPAGGVPFAAMCRKTCAIPAGGVRFAAMCRKTCAVRARGVPFAAICRKTCAIPAGGVRFAAMCRKTCTLQVLATCRTVGGCRSWAGSTPAECGASSSCWHRWGRGSPRPLRGARQAPRLDGADAAVALGQSSCLHRIRHGKQPAVSAPSLASVQERHCVYAPGRRRDAVRVGGDRSPG